MSNGHPLCGHFYSVLFVVALDFFYLSGVRCWFCCKSFRSFPPSSILIYVLRSLFCRTYRTHTLLLWRSLCHLLTFLSHHARRPRDDELDRQVITSGSKFQPTPLPLPYPRFQPVLDGIYFTHLRRRPVLSFMSAYPLSVFPTTPLRWLVL